MDIDYIQINTNNRCLIYPDVVGLNSNVSNNIENIYGAGYIEPTDAASYDEDYNSIILTSANGEYTLSGYITKNIIVSQPSIDILLDEAYITGNIIYTPNSKKLKIEALDDATLGDNASLNKVNVIRGTISSGKNITFEGKGVIIANNVSAAGKFTLYNDGVKIFNNCNINKFYIGCDDDNYDAITDKTSSQNVYINSLTFTEASNIYVQQKGDVYIKNLSSTALTPEEYFKRNKTLLTIAEGGKIDEDQAYSEVEISGIECFNYNEIEIADYTTFEPTPVLVGDWIILSETPDIKMNIPSYNSIEIAEADLINLNLGEVISIKSDSSENYINDYDLYIVVSDGVSKVLKELKGGSGEGGYSSTLTFDTSVKVNNESTNNYECNIGDVITFTSTFTSSDYSDTRGTIYGKINGETIFTSAVYPREGIITTWAYNTQSLKAGTYIFTLYGKESTGKTSERKTFEFQVGGLNLESSFADGTVVASGLDLTIPVTIAAADTSAEITLNVKVDDVLVSDNVVTTNTRSILIEAASLSIGVHNIELQLENNKGKTSQKLKYSIIIAEEGNVYIISDKDEYQISDGGIAVLAIRTIQIGCLNEKFPIDVDIKYKNALTNYRETISYMYNYGINELDISGLRFSQDYVNGTIEDETVENGTLRYSEFELTLTVKSPLNELITESVTIPIKVVENNYNIEAYDDNLALYFTAEGKSNNAANRAEWQDLSGNNVEAEFVNFNWQSNGWIKDDENNTALKVNHGAYVELKYSPFSDPKIDEVYDPAKNQEGGALTISIDFKTKNILNSTAKVVSCLYETEGNDTITRYLRDSFGDYVKFDDSAIIEPELYYTDDTKTEVTRTETSYPFDYTH